MRTVIVEPRELARRGLRRTLEASGCSVIGMATSFPGAVRILTTLPGVDIAFIDLDAELGGRALIELATSRAIPVVVTAGAARIPDHLKGFALLAGPISDEQIASVLAAVPGRDAIRH